MSSSTTVRLVLHQVTSASWWFRSCDGRLIVGQFPNPALFVWMVALALGWLELSADQATAVEGVGRGALLVWALDEVVRGANPFRRLLGAVVLAPQIASLVLA